MPTFDAGAEPITFDFSKYVPGCAGEIPEPTTDQIETFAEMLRQIMPVKAPEGGDPDGKPELDVAAILTRVEGGEDIELLLNTAVSDVCSNAFSAEDVKALPYRVKTRFYGWIVGTFLSPEV